MSVSEDPRVEPHTDDGMECGIELQCLLDRGGCIIFLSLHHSTYIEEIILCFVSPSGVYEKYRIISMLDEIVIDLRDFSFIFPEEVTTAYRYTDAFLFWHLCWGWWRLIEKCDIWYLGAGDLEGFEESGTFFITDDDEVSLLEDIMELHFIFHLLYFERESEKDDSRTKYPSKLRSKPPLHE
jgi:hypothetical protein